MKLCIFCGAQHDDREWRCPRCGGAPECRNGVYTLAPAVAFGDGTDAAYRFDDLSAAEDRHFWFRHRHRLIAWAFERFFPAAQSLLDVGCGTGGVPAHLAHRLPHVHVTAADILHEGLAHARGRLNSATMVQMDARSIPFEAEFDVVGAFDVLEHVEDDERVLREMFKATRAGGGVVITVPQHAALWSAQDVFSHHKRRYSRSEALAKLGRAGYRAYYATSFITLLLPALVLNRMLSTSTHAFDPVAELRIASPLNYLFGRITDVERWLIEAGCRMPLGGSLLVVGFRPDL